MLKGWWPHAHRAIRSRFARNALWFTGLSAFERVVALAQTVVLARALGITEYGIYGLLFGAMGLVSSLIGLQMGLTATVFVARYRETEKAKTAAVISITSRFSWAIALLFAATTAPFGREISLIVLGEPGHELAMLLALLFVSLAILSGVQDGIAQGFEIFVPLATLKAVIAVLTLAAVYPAAMYFELTGALCALLAGPILKLIILQLLVQRSRHEAGIPRVGSGVSFNSLVSNFALPSLAVSALLGITTWAGMFILSRQDTGFSGVAIANAALQWRGPVLLLSASLGSVAIPAFGRLAARHDTKQSTHLRRALSFFNFAIASAVAIVLLLNSHHILALYGPEFIEGQLAFGLIVLSTVPTLVTNVYMHELVGAARMWRQLLMHIPFVLVVGVGFATTMPSMGVNGYAWSLLVGSCVFLAQVLIIEYLKPRRRTASL